MENETTLSLFSVVFSCSQYTAAQQAVTVPIPNPAVLTPHDATCGAGGATDALTGSAGGNPRDGGKPGTLKIVSRATHCFKWRIRIYPQNKRAWAVSKHHALVGARPGESRCFSGSSQLQEISITPLPDIVREEGTLYRSIASISRTHRPGTSCKSASGPRDSAGIGSSSYDASLTLPQIR